MKTGVSYLKEPVYGSYFNWRSESQLQNSQYQYYNRFDGQAIVIPINIKWEFRIFKNLHGNLKMGNALNIETKTNYNYNNDKKGTSSTFVNFNLGYGLNYYLSEKYSIGIDLESYLLGKTKGKASSNKSWWEVSATNSVASLQIKYHF